MASYNYDGFSTADYDFDAQIGPRAGDKAPDFTLTTPDGDQRRLLEFEGDFLVLEMGSITCPLFQSRRPIMERLDTAFPSVSTAVLYVREAHPGADVPSHKDFAQKSACAARLQVEDGEHRTIFVDAFDGRAHRAYGQMPNSVYIIDQTGCVRFHSKWNNPSATRRALQALTTGQPASIRSFFRPARPDVVFKTLGRAGRGSALDFFKGLPMLIWTNLIKRNLRILFGRDSELDIADGC